MTAEACRDPVPTCAIKICLIGTFPGLRGGVSVHLGRLHAALISEGFESKIVNEGTSRLPYAHNLRGDSPFNYIKIVFSSEIIHIHSSNSYIMFMHVLIGVLFGKRVIITLHSGRKRGLSRLIQNAASRLASLTIAVSDEIAQSVSGRAVTIPAFIKPEHWECRTPAEFDEISLNARSNGRKVIVTNVTNAGTFEGSEIYGIDTVVHAMQNAILQEQFEAVIFVSDFVDREKYVLQLTELINQSNLGERCHIFEYSGPMAGAIAKADVLVRATNTDGDSLSVREALYFGTPVIASDCAQRPPGVILFESRNSKSLAEKLLNFQSDGVPTPAIDDFFKETCRAYLNI